MKKKLFAMVLCVIMVVAMAVPAFADSGVYQQSFYYKSWNGSGGYMNVYTTGSPYPGVLLKTWPTNAEKDQIWDRYNENNQQIYFSLRARANGAYAVNRDSSNGNAILWPIDGGFNDSLFYDPIIDLEYLVNYPSNGCLSVANGGSSGVQIYFGPKVNPNTNFNISVAPKK